MRSVFVSVLDYILSLFCSQYYRMEGNLVTKNPHVYSESGSVSKIQWFLSVMLRCCMVLKACRIGARAAERKPFQVSEGPQSHSDLPVFMFIEASSATDPSTCLHTPMYFTLRPHLVTFLILVLPARHVELNACLFFIFK